MNNYAIGYYNYNGPQTNNIPKNGISFPATGVVHLDGCSTCNLSASDPIPNLEGTAVNMIQEMKKRGWKLAFQKADSELSANSIRRSDQGYGGGEIFTQATIGLFMTHGSYGIDPDYKPGSSGSKQTYWASSNPGDSGDNVWLRMCQFGFGGNLKWMAILACNSLCDPNYSSMVNAGAIPLKTTHLLCGTATIAAMEENLCKYWAANMIGSKQEIKDAWFNAGSKAYHEADQNALANDTIIFRVTGYSECIDDTVANNTEPTNPSSAPGDLIKRDQQVYP